jgi:hypothetical protein
MMEEMLEVLERERTAEREAHEPKREAERREYKITRDASGKRRDHESGKIKENETEKNSTINRLSRSSIGNNKCKQIWKLECRHRYWWL